MRQRVVISRSQAHENHWDFESALAGMCVAEGGLSVLLIPHLYHLRENSPIWERLAGGGPLIVATWLYARPAQWLLRLHGAGECGLEVFCLKDYATPEEAFARVLELAGKREGNSEDGSEEAEGGESGLEELTEPASERWYPVVDGERCHSCGQCYQFCLFGVYTKDSEGRVVVTNPDQCKPGCPACSRICPDGAIIFPAYERDDAIAGAPGRFMAPDAAARKMFYARTRRPCPVCSALADGPPSSPGAEVCEECGRPKPGGGGGGGGAGENGEKDGKTGGDGQVAEFLRDDLDSLLDDLNQLAGE